MPNIQVKLRRGTTSQHTGFQGADGEVTVDTDKKTLIVHTDPDSGTPDSTELRRKDDTIANAEIDNDAVDTAQIADDAVTPAKLDDTQTYTVSGLISDGANIAITRGAEGPGLRLTYDATTDEVRDFFVDSAGDFKFKNVSGGGTQGTLMTLNDDGNLNVTGNVAGTDVVESSGSSTQVVRSSSSASLGYVIMYSGGEPLNQKRVNLVPDGGKFVLSWVNDDTTSGLAVQLDQATGAWEANSDNAQNLGSSSNRWDNVYATNGNIQTSDRNEKEEIEDLSEAELRVATAIKGLIKKFKFKGRVRKHIGVIAQDVEAAFTAEGLNASEYGLFCSDTFEDEDGNSVTRLGVRYEELLAFVIAAM
jgi:hypothetical protein